MGKRFAIVIGVAALGAAVMAAGASADYTSVDDPRGDTKCFHEIKHQHCSDSKRRNADIVRATAGHDGALLKHTIRVVGEPRLVSLWINTDSDPECEFWAGAIRDRARYDVTRCRYRGRTGSTGHASYDFHGHSLEISFSQKSIGNPQSYGWQVTTESLGKDYLHANAEDSVPNSGPTGPPHYIEHRLG